MFKYVCTVIVIVLLMAAAVVVTVALNVVSNVVVVELLYSLKIILLLGGLSHTLCIWPDPWVKPLSTFPLVSPRFNDVRAYGVVCCCNSWRLCLMCRRVGRSLYSTS